MHMKGEKMQMTEKLQQAMPRKVTNIRNIPTETGLGEYRKRLGLMEH